MRELIKAQEKSATGQAELLLQKVRKEIAELKANEAELSKLSTMEDNIQFLQVFGGFPVSRTVIHIYSYTNHAWLCLSRVARFSKLHLCYQPCLQSLPSLA